MLSIAVELSRYVHFVLNCHHDFLTNRCLVYSESTTSKAEFKPSKLHGSQKLQRPNEQVEQAEQDPDTVTDSTRHPFSSTTLNSSLHPRYFVSPSREWCYK